MKERKKSSIMDDEKEFKNTLDRIRMTFGLREWTLILFFITVILLKLTGSIDYFKQINWVILILSVWLISSYIFRFLVGKQTTASGLINLYLRYDIFVELPLLSLIVYNAGGVEWIGSMFFLFPIVYIGIVFPRKNALMVYTAASIYYLLLVLLPYFNIIPFKPYFYLETNFHHNLNYVINNILFTIPTFYLIGSAASFITNLLKKRTTELEKVKGELEKERVTLEIRIKNRTQELQELTVGLEGKVKERTRELEEKMKELDRFNKLSVDRELKMIELKKEIEELKKTKQQKNEESS